MNFLLDTHVVLWLAVNSEKLSEAARVAIFDAASKKYVSIVSAWEVAIKLSVQKLQLEGGVAEFFRIVESNGFGLLPLTQAEIERVETLPWRHRDPFDRLLVATAQTHGMTLITADENIPKYDVSHILAS
ncbi:MAG: type II toxin-antitoxin system VapC family toxin [Candidatus Accumulibacter sp.]|nr:type II toxin-antitoxin system VapC family toxin [Accumulibacter sp.]